MHGNSRNKLCLTTVSVLSAILAAAIAAPFDTAIAQQTKAMEDTITIGERLTHDGRVAICGIYLDESRR